MITLTQYFILVILGEESGTLIRKVLIRVEFVLIDNARALFTNFRQVFSLVSRSFDNRIMLFLLLKSILRRERRVTKTNLRRN